MNHDDLIIVHAPDDRASRAMLRDRAKQLVIDDLEREIRYLRAYGNKDCTAMADFGMTINSLERP